MIQAVIFRRGWILFAARDARRLISRFRGADDEYQSEKNVNERKKKVVRWVKEGNANESKRLTLLRDASSWWKRAKSTERLDPCPA